MREFLIVWAGRHQRDEWDALFSRYRDRIQHTVPVREVPVKVRSAAGDDAARARAEADAIRAVLPDPCWTIALDRRGRQRSSVEWAGRLGDLLDTWAHPVAFVLGSDIGLDPRFVRECRETLSFGPLTLPHELARLVLAEQIYRALSIRAGIKYHRAPL